MKSYNHHIADFLTATMHLSRHERSIYLDLIWLYYDKEEPLPNDIQWLSKKIRAIEPNMDSTGVHQVLDCVEGVLKEFFELTDSGWFHERCELVIDQYKNNTTKKSLAGIASAKKREELKKKRIQELKRTNTSSTGVEQTLNKCATERQQNSTNLKPKTKNQYIPDSDFDLLWSRYSRTTGTSKADANKAWSKMTDVEKKKALDVVELFNQNWKSTNTEEKFIPHLSSWLNKKYFETPPNCSGGDGYEGNVV